VNSPADELLMIQVRDGDVALLGTLFERHHLALYNFFVRLTSRRHASEDLVQEVFLRMLKYRHTYRGEKQFTMWMFQIARNAWVDHLRKNRREQSMPEQLPEPVSTERLASEKLEEGEDIDLLRVAMQKLSDDKREVLVLSRFHDMKYDEIADLLGCAVGTVKARVHRALHDLRRIFFELSSEQPI